MSLLIAFSKPLPLYTRSSVCFHTKCPFHVIHGQRKTSAWVCGFFPNPLTVEAILTDFHCDLIKLTAWSSSLGQ